MQQNEQNMEYEYFINNIISVDCLDLKQVKDKLNKMICEGESLDKEINGVSALYLFTKNRRIDLVKLFIELGASVNNKSLIKNLILGNNDLARYEITLDILDCIQYLINRQAPVVLDQETEVIFKELKTFYSIKS